MTATTPTASLISKEIVHAVTSLGAKQASAASLAEIARGQWGIESVHWLRDTAWAEDASTGYAGNGPQIMATLRNLAVSLLYLAGVKDITRTLQAIARSEPACSITCRYETQISNDFADPVRSRWLEIRLQAIVGTCSQISFDTIAGYLHAVST